MGIFINFINPDGVFKSEFYALKRGEHKHQVAFKRTDASVDIEYYFLYKGLFYEFKDKVSGSFSIDDLEIEVLKNNTILEPGFDSSWNLKIKKQDSSIVTAEVLARMYDASLDKFTNNTWYNKLNKKPYTNIPYSRKTINYFNSLNNNLFNPTYYYSNKNSFYQMPMQVETFGFSMVNIDAEHHKYLKRLKENTKTTMLGKLNISGYVLDENGIPLAGVNLVTNNFKGTQTDFDGFFSLQGLLPSEEVRFSYLGYKTQTVITQAFNGIVVMQEDFNNLDEIVVSGYTSIDAAGTLCGAVAGVNFNYLSKVNAEVEKTQLLTYTGQPGQSGTIILRGVSDLSNSSSPLYFVNGVPINENEFIQLQADDLSAITVLKDVEAVSLYGNRGANGVVIITTKEKVEIQSELSNIKPRDDLKETAFFMPHLYTDKEGSLVLQFKNPEALTRWNVSLLAHNKQLQSSLKNLSVTTQKKINISPNFPRFFRQGDHWLFSAKITNMTEEKLKGTALLEFKNPMQDTLVNWVKNSPQASFSLEPKATTDVQWQLKIDADLEEVEYFFAAKAKNFTDAETGIIPVLSDKVLLTKIHKVTISNNEQQTLNIKEYLKGIAPNSVKNISISAPSPVWAESLEAISYQLDFPYQCNEQIFAKWHSRIAAQSLFNRHSFLKDSLEHWKNSFSKDTLTSNLKKKKSSPLALKSVLLKSINHSTYKTDLIAYVNQIRTAQNDDGGIPWFKGGSSSFFVSAHILKSIGELQLAEIEDAQMYFDESLLEDIADYLSIQLEHREKANLKTSDVVNYFYAMSFFPKYQNNVFKQQILPYIKGQQEKLALLSDSEKFKLVITAFNQEQNSVAKKILKTQSDKLITHKDGSAYWSSYADLPTNEAIEAQALAIIAYRIFKDDEVVSKLQKHLIKLKSNARWNNTKATTTALNALVNNNFNSKEHPESFRLTYQKKPISPRTAKDSWSQTWDINAQLAIESPSEFLIENNSDFSKPAYIKILYEGDIKSIEANNHKELGLKKSVFIVEKSTEGTKLIPVDNQRPKVGDVLHVSIEINAAKAFEYMHLQDFRPACVEPLDVISEYRREDNLGFFQTTKDTSTHFFIESLPKGKHSITYQVRVERSGSFAGGYTSIENMYKDYEKATISSEDLIVD